MITITHDTIPPAGLLSGDASAVMRELASRIEQLAALAPPERPVVFALLLPVACLASLAVSLPIYLLIERPLSLGLGPKAHKPAPSPASGIVGRVSG